MIEIVAKVLAVVLLFGLLIFVHEFGHFLAARGLGLVVDTFSLGFGPALWKRTFRGVTYKIGAIPLGGYVAIPQLDPSGMDAVQGKNAPDGTAPRHLPPAAPWRRILVSCAGPAGNLLLASVLAWAIYLTPNDETGRTGTQIGTVLTNAPAWPAGLRPGQVIETVNGERVATWYDIEQECQLAGDARRGVALTVRDNGAERRMTVPLTVFNEGGENRQILDGVWPQSVCLFEEVFPGGAAAAGGARTGDCVRAVNGRPVFGMRSFLDFMQGNGTNAVRLDLVRDGRPLTLALAPRLDEATGRPMIGVMLADGFRDLPSWMQYSKPWRQIRADASAVFRLLRALFFPTHKGEAGQAARSVRGVPTIFVALWTALQMGVLSCFGLVRLISVNLAILNLLPIPVLDGGHVVFALWELVTRRRPNPKVVAVLVNVFAVLIIGLMLLLVVRDPHIRRLVPDSWYRLIERAPAAATANAAATNAAAPAATNAAAPEAPRP